MLIRPEQIMAKVPAGWDHLFFGWKLTLDWSHLMPQLNTRIYGPVAGGDGYSLFMFFTGMLLLKGVLVSMAGPTPNYAIQHVLSTRSPREAALENMVMAMVSLAPRFLLIAGITVLGWCSSARTWRRWARKVNFEKILPNVLNIYVPVGLKRRPDRCSARLLHEHLRLDGELGRGLRGQRHLQALPQPSATPPAAGGAGLDHVGRGDLLGILFGLATKSVHGVTEWIVSALVPAFVAPNVLKWHWWRFNGYGFFAGMVAGTAAAVLKVSVNIHPVFGFLLILAISSRRRARRIAGDAEIRPKADDRLAPGIGVAAFPGSAAVGIGTVHAGHHHVSLVDRFHVHAKDCAGRICCAARAPAAAIRRSLQLRETAPVRH